MAEIEYYLGTEGPFLIDDTDPLFASLSQIARKKDLENVLTAADIVDNLASVSSTKALSANQGRVLDEKIADITIKEYQIGTSTPTGKTFTIRKYDDGTFDWEEL